jgi:hypothetical protein
LTVGINDPPSLPTLEGMRLLIRRSVLVLVGLVVGCGAGEVLHPVEQIAAHAPELAAALAPHPGAWQLEADGYTSAGWRNARRAPLEQIGVRLPTRANQPVQVGIGQSTRLQMEWTLQGGAPSAAREDAGRVLYRGVAPATDLVYVAGELRVEAFLLLRRPSAPSEFRWRITLPAGLPTVRRTGAGGLELLDEAGRSRLHVPPAFLVDAEGRRRAADLQLADGVLVVRAETRGLTFPVLLDPAVEVATWQQVAGPPPTSFGASAYDTTRHRIVFFTESLPSTTPLADTWEWDGSVWSYRTPIGPPLRSGTAMAYDASRGRTVLFGGQLDPWTIANDTWEWDGDHWSEPTSQTLPPSARTRSRLVYDSTRARTVLFGGSTLLLNSDMLDVWEWDGSRWTQRPFTGGPASFGAVAYDSARARMIMYGGRTSGAQIVPETWEWDGTWNARGVTAGTATGGAMAYDAARQRIVLSTPTVWEYDGTQWSQAGPMLWDNNWQTLLYASDRGRVLGLGPASISQNDSTLTVSEWLGTSWSVLPGWPRATDGQRTRLRRSAAASRAPGRPPEHERLGVERDRLGAASDRRTAGARRAGAHL